MSWDVCVMRFSEPYDSIDDIPDDVDSLPLGSRRRVHEAVTAWFPGVDWGDPAWGRWDSSFGSIEFNVGDADPVESLMLHVRAGPEVVPAIVGLCLHEKWQAIDCSMGDLLERREDPTAGLEAWQAYRDRVIDEDDPRSWLSDRSIDALGIALACMPWMIPGETALVHVGAVVGCVGWWVMFRRWMSSFEMPIAVIPLSFNLRLLLYVLA